LTWLKLFGNFLALGLQTKNPKAQQNPQVSEVVMSQRVWNQEKFDEWKRAVDAVVIRKTGISTGCLPDWGFADSFLRYDTPTKAAAGVIKAAKEF